MTRETWGLRIAYGEPVKVLFDSRVPLDALGWRMMRWWGVEPWMNAAFIWRLIRKRKISQRLYNLLWWPSRRIRLDAAQMTREHMRDFVREFNSIRPSLLQGYVGGVHTFAKFIEDEGLQISSPKAVWVTSSPVSRPQRTLVERVFSAPLFDQYGCGEVSWLAAQCAERAGLHVFHDTRLIEFVDDCFAPVGPGEIGRILLTDLENYAFPIIRYENGDLGRTIPGECPCGISLPLMDGVKGRQTDMIMLPDGSSIAGDYLTTVFDDFPDCVSGFQFRQEADYSLHLLYVPSGREEEASKAIEKIRTDLKERSAGQLPIWTKRVSEISHEEGKTRYVVSKLAESSTRL